MLFLLAVAVVLAFVLYKVFYKPVPPPRFLGKVGRRRHAVVIGAGIGGIGAARVLSDYFEKVTLIDRDSIDLDHPTGRSGVPQGQQLHGLQAKGATIAEMLFPGIIEEWLSHGAAQLDVLRDTLINWQGNCLPHSERMKEGPSIYGIAMSRPFNEFHLRRRLLADRSNVELLTKTTVLGLLHEKEEDGTVRVKGVTIKRPPSPPLRSPRKREEEGGGEQQKDQNEFLLSPRSRAVIEDMDADFVVCSTGRKNRMIKWLKDMKVIGEEDPVPSDTCDPGICYVSARFKIPEGWREKHKEDFADAMGSLGSPLSVPFAMGAIRLEGGLVHLLATTYGNNPPPNTTEEIMKFFEPAFSGLPGGDVFREMFKEFEQVSGWEVFHDQKNVFNHFEKLGTRWPQNFVALGDTVATFTPTYAQGMTNALMHAHALKDVFHKHLYDYPVHDLYGLSLKFQKQAASISKNFWVAVEPSDLQWPTTIGTRTWLKEFLGVFQFYLFREACKSRDKMLKVQMLSNGVANPALVMLDAELILPALYYTALNFWEKWQKEKKAGKA